MSFLSRFFKTESEEDDPLAGLEDEEEAGLFINEPRSDKEMTEPLPMPKAAPAPHTADSVSAAEAPPRPPDTDGREATASRENDALEELEATASGEPVSDAEEEQPTQPTVEASEESPQKDTGTDDLLSAFRESALDLNASSLTKDLENYSIEDVLKEAREISRLLDIPPSNGNSEAA